MVGWRLRGHRNHPRSQPPCILAIARRRGQQRRVRHHASGADSYAMFNRLTGPERLDRVEALLPEHRERLFPPTETLSLFLPPGAVVRWQLPARGQRRPGQTGNRWAEARQYGHRWLLSGTGASAGEEGLAPGARDGRDRYPGGGRGVTGAPDRRDDGPLGGHRSESGDHSAAGKPTAGARVSDPPRGGAAVPGQRCAARWRDRSLWGQRRRRATPVARDARFPPRRRHPARG